MGPSLGHVVTKLALNTELLFLLIDAVSVERCKEYGLCNETNLSFNHKCLQLTEASQKTPLLPFLHL